MALLRHITILAQRAVAAGDLRPLYTGAGLVGLLVLTGAASQALLARTGSSLVAELRLELSQWLVDMDFEKLMNRKSLVFRVLIEDVSRVAPLVMTGPQLVYNVFLAMLCLLYLATISVKLFSILFFGMALVVAALLILEWHTRRGFDKLRGSEERLFEHFRAIGEGKKEMSVNAARMRHFSNSLLRPAVHESRRLMKSVHFVWGLSDEWSPAALYATVSIVIYVANALMHLPVPVTVQFVVGALFLVGPVAAVSRMGIDVAKGLASLRGLDRMGLVLASDNAAPSSSLLDRDVVRSDWQRIRLKDVCYRYLSDAQANPGIGPIDLEFRRGEMIFFTGGNGSGKSTLMLLLCGLLRPQSGQILMDEQPISDSLVDYRRLFSGVFSDCFLFTHVLDATGKLAPDQQIDTLLAKLKLEHRVSAEQGELDTIALSAGQRKRIALLQCYAENRDIYFFDEWAAEQDVDFRDHFYRVLLPELKLRGKTILAISHDDRYFDVADRVITLRQGVIEHPSDAALDHAALADIETWRAAPSGRSA
jgi:cyclic peptide transporter